MRENKQGLLLKNTVMLYILIFSNYLFSFVTVPYQTRVLGPEVYGEVGFAQGLSVYVQLFLDFGFILSATEDVARNRSSDKELSRIVSAVLACKLILGVLAFAVVSVLLCTITRFRENVILYQLFFISTFFNCLLPDFLYRGIEKMSTITYRAVAMKAFFTVAIFLFMKDKTQYYMIPVMNCLGNIGACVWTYYDVYHNCKVKLVPVSTAFIWKTLCRSSGYFVSRIASTVYSATNTMIVGFIHPAGSVLGYYISAEKLMTTARSAFSPIADSLYPYMVNNKDYKMVKKIMMILMPIILVGCTVVGFFAEEFCIIMFGRDFAASGYLLRLLMPIVLISLPIYVCGFPILSPMGLGKYANYSVVAAAIFHAAVLCMLYLLGALTVENICIATCVTESLVLIIRVCAIVFGYRHHKND